MSQTFDEGGAKGMLLANLGVYDGAKILLNSADVHLTTRKPIERKAKKVDDEESTSAEEVPVVVPPKPERIDLSSLGKLSCFSKDVTVGRVSPVFVTLYEANVLGYVCSRWRCVHRLVVCTSKSKNYGTRPRRSRGLCYRTRC
jgi:hypothetical protein